MSAKKAVSRSVRTYIDLFDEELVWGQMRGLPGDWNGLRRRLDALSQKATDREAAGATINTPASAHRLEHRLLVDVLREMLLPAVLDGLVDTLRSAWGRADLGVWAPLDRELLKRHRRRESLADASVLAALKKHARKPSHLRILEGLRALEDLDRVGTHLDPGFDPVMLVDEKNHLVEVVESLLPPTARQVLGREVEARFRSHVEGTPINQLEPARAFWHNHIPGVGLGDPIWNQFSHGDQPDPLGTWFVPGVQAAYEAMHEQVEIERAKEVADEKRVQRAAAARRRRQERKEADQRALQARLEKEERVREQKQERRRQAEAERAEQRIRLERERQQEEQRAEFERAQEQERQARVETKRRSRGPTPSTPIYWKRRPEEIWRRQAEGEFKKWCKKKGVLPQDFTDEHREKVMREIC